MFDDRIFGRILSHNRFFRYQNRLQQTMSYFYDLEAEGVETKFKILLESLIPHF